MLLTTERPEGFTAVFSLLSKCFVFFVSMTLFLSLSLSNLVFVRALKAFEMEQNEIGWHNFLCQISHHFWTTFFAWSQNKCHHHHHSPMWIVKIFFLLFFLLLAFNHGDKLTESLPNILCSIYSVLHTFQFTLWNALKLYIYSNSHCNRFDFLNNFIVE